MVSGFDVRAVSLKISSENETGKHRKRLRTGIHGHNRFDTGRLVLTKDGAVFGDRHLGGRRLLCDRNDNEHDNPQ